MYGEVYKKHAVASAELPGAQPSLKDLGADSALPTRHCCTIGRSSFLVGRL